MLAIRQRISIRSFCQDVEEAGRDMSDMTKLSGSQRRLVALLQILSTLKEADSFLLRASDALHRHDLHNIAIDHPEKGDAATQLAAAAGIVAHVRNQLGKQLPKETWEEVRADLGLD